jgi:hypothetical protein
MCVAKIENYKIKKKQNHHIAFKLHEFLKDPNRKAKKKKDIITQRKKIA